MEPTAVGSEIVLRSRTIRVLRWGFRVSVAIIAIGLAIAVARGDALPDTLGTPADIVPDILHGKADGVIGLGILAMILTPFTCACVLAGTFWQQGDRRYAGICALVVVILLISLLVSTL